MNLEVRDTKFKNDKIVDVASKLNAVAASSSVVAVASRIEESELLSAFSRSALGFGTFEFLCEEDEKASPNAKTFLTEDNFLESSNSSINEEEINAGDFTKNSRDGEHRSKESHIEAVSTISPPKRKNVTNGILEYSIDTLVFDERNPNLYRMGKSSSIHFEQVNVVVESSL